MMTAEVLKHPMMMAMFTLAPVIMMSMRVTLQLQWVILLLQRAMFLLLLREGFDYLETFSPEVKMSTVRCMLNIAMCNNWDIFQLDIKNALLYGDLSEDVYMTLPLGFDNEKSKVSLIEHRFVHSKFDYSLFTKKYDNVFYALLVYVGDIVITGSDLSEIEKFK
nr:ribonuclease H-like domain-containing protein [Tanacetum cinerariifolium]